MNWTLYKDALFSIEQCYDCPLPGYLIVRLNEPVGSWSDLPPQTLKRIGSILQKAVRAVDEALEPERIYVAQFGEADGDLHFHVFPRTKEITKQYFEAFPRHADRIHGPLLLDWARDQYQGNEPSGKTLDTMKELKAMFAS